MKRLLLYFIALTCAVCILSGCRKEERKEDRKPVIEGVYWCPERMKDSLNEDGISGTITVTDKSFGDEEVNTYVFSELTSDSVLIDFSGEPERYYSAEKCGFTVTGTVDLDW